MTRLSTTPRLDRYWLTARYIIFFCMCLALVIMGLLINLISRVNALGTIITEPTIQGTFGVNGWYVSDLAVKLIARSTDSVPKSLHYWINNNPSQVVDYPRSKSQYFNTSFEEREGSIVKGWYPDSSGEISVFSSLNAYDQNHSLALLVSQSAGNGFHYVDNKPHALAFSRDETFDAEIMVQTYMDVTAQAYFEVWGEDLSRTSSVLLETSTLLDGSSTSWRKLTVSTVVPTGYPYIFIKFGVLTGNTALLYWDDLRVVSSINRTAQLAIKSLVEGSYNFNFYSQDLLGNVEGVRTVVIKKDTVKPIPWNNQTAVTNGCALCVRMQTEIQDVTSGLSMSSANYRVVKANGTDWSDWKPVVGLVDTSTNQPAIDGTVFPTRLITNDYSTAVPSERPVRMQFKVSDMAGNLVFSPIYSLQKAGFQAINGSIYIGGSIYGNALQSIPFANGDVAATGGVVDFSTTQNWISRQYAHSLYTKAKLTAVIPSYDVIREKADTMIEAGFNGTYNSLPAMSGIYLYAGDLNVIDNSSLETFLKTDQSTVVIVDGDLTITQNMKSERDNHTIFIVNGSISVLPTVSEIRGYFITQETFETVGGLEDDGEIVIYGSVVALAGTNFNRSNIAYDSNTPLEKLVWEPDYLLDDDLTNLIANKKANYGWIEVDGP